MRYQLWTQHVLPPYQPIRLLLTSGNIEDRSHLNQWLSGKMPMRSLEDHERYLVCNEESEYYQFVDKEPS